MNIHQCLRVKRKRKMDMHLHVTAELFLVMECLRFHCLIYKWGAQHLSENSHWSGQEWLWLSCNFCSEESRQIFLPKEDFEEWKLQEERAAVHRQVSYHLTLSNIRAGQSIVGKTSHAEQGLSRAERQRHPGSSKTL